MATESRQRRDLRWCLESAALPTGESWSESDLTLPAALDPDPPPHAHQFRLGQHFERLLTAWLESSTRFELIEANLPVRDGKRTVGEFDFLVKSGDDIEHWEAAIKFYLGTGDRTHLGNWFGPNTADRFDIKMARLDTHQLQLASHPAARKLLEARDIGIARSRCFMKGRLFHPWRETKVWPARINPQHERGWWMSLADFQRDMVDAGARFVYLPKSLWLSPLVREDIDSALSFWEILELLQSPHAEQATHLAIVGDAGETSRGFVVNDHWLARVNAS